jgi:hypothetical protein
MSKAATKVSSDINGKKQTAFYYDTVFGNSTKSSFTPNDQYLLGKNSCGCYMFLLPRDEKSLKVNGDDSLSTAIIEVGDNNSVSIPLVFQYRMTDYYGLGYRGIGAIGGDYTGVTTDLRYAKKMGIDLFDVDGNRFSFDLEIFAKYAVDKLNIDTVPSISISNAIKQLTENIPGTQPNINLKEGDIIRSLTNVSSGSSTGGCFVKGTQVTLSNGTRVAIENIENGEEVLTYNNIAGQYEVGKVIDTHRPKHSDLIDIKLENSTDIKCTSWHPFWSVNKKTWVSFKPELTQEYHDMVVSKLEQYDILLDDKGLHVKIDNILSNKTTGKKQTYNITVEGNNNYFANGILVHNKRLMNQT